MANYHLEAKVISRGAGRSACAASAYLSCSAILNEYDGVRHDYTRKQGLVWREVFLPEYAPQEWQDRAVLWNVVEENEKTKDSRLAREFVPALPVELTKEQWQELLSDFIQESFISDGMCADVAIHDPDPPGHNPHAHIMLTVRPLDENGKWQYKTEKEYLCVKNGEERGFTAAEFKAAQADGWEKQYQYKVGRADVTNKYLERYGHEERIDHRSFAERGIEEQPTIHEGVSARAMEAKGIISDRCELNRQIKADNKLLRELKAQVKKIAEAIKNTLPDIADALETVRENMIIFCYQLGHIRSGKKQMNNALNILKPDQAQYLSLVKQIKTTAKERKALLAEKKSLPGYNIFKHKELSAKIAELTEKLEELKSEKAFLLHSLEYPEDATSDTFQSQIDRYEDHLKRLEAQEKKYAGELEAALSEYAELKEQASGFDSLELYLERMALRPDKEKAVAQRIETAYGGKFSWRLMESSKRDVSGYLDEYIQEKAMERELRQRRRAEWPESKMKNKDMER